MTPRARRLLLINLNLLALLILWGLSRDAERLPLVRYPVPLPGAKRVLWIGNSHTTNGSLPHRVQRMLEQAGHPPVYIRTHTSVQTLQEHDRDDELTRALTEPWDLIIAQEQSSASVWKLWWTRQILNRLHQQTHAPVLFYQVWSNTHGISKLSSAARIQHTLDQLGCMIDQQEGISTSFVGHAIQEAREQGATVTYSDGNHLFPSGVERAVEVLTGDIAAALFNDTTLQVDSPTSRIVCTDTAPLPGPVFFGKQVIVHSIDDNTSVFETSSSLVTTGSLPNQDLVRTLQKPVVKHIDMQSTRRSHPSIDGLYITEHLVHGADHNQVVLQVISEKLWHFGPLIDNRGCPRVSPENLADLTDVVWLFYTSDAYYIVGRGWPSLKDPAFDLLTMSRGLREQIPPDRLKFTSTKCGYQELYSKMFQKKSLTPVAPAIPE